MSKHSLLMFASQKGDASLKLDFFETTIGQAFLAACFAMIYPKVMASPN